MNMQTAITMTAAETALVDAYTAQIGELPGEGAVLSARDTPARRPEETGPADTPRRILALYGPARACCGAFRPSIRRRSPNGSIRWLRARRSLPC